MTRSGDYAQLLKALCISPLARGLGGRVVHPVDHACAVSRVKTSGRDKALCPNCGQVGEALNVCGLGPESLRELFDTLRVIGPSEVKEKMEILRDLGMQMDMQDRSQLN